ncbi:MAG: QueT transporter family protein [Clostridia bacterium]|nr:QueT transporter family protein [Clostridia bacterium]
MKNATRLICINATVAALYVVFTVILGSFGYGILQLRIAEALTILPALAPHTMFGLAIGCAIANIASPFGIWDIAIGSLITLLAGFLTSKIKNPFLAALPPILLNAIFLPVLWIALGSDEVYIYNVLSLTVSQSVVLYALGIPLFYFAKKHLIEYLVLKDR